MLPFSPAPLTDENLSLNFEKLVELSKVAAEDATLNSKIRFSVIVEQEIDGGTKCFLRASYDFTEDLNLAVQAGEWLENKKTDSIKNRMAFLTERKKIPVLVAAAKGEIFNEFFRTLEQIGGQELVKLFHRHLYHSGVIESLSNFYTESKILHSDLVEFLPLVMANPDGDKVELVSPAWWLRAPKNVSHGVEVARAVARSISKRGASPASATVADFYLLPLTDSDLTIYGVTPGELRGNAIINRPRPKSNTGVEVDPKKFHSQLALDWLQSGNYLQRTLSTLGITAGISCAIPR